MISLRKFLDPQSWDQVACCVMKRRQRSRLFVSSTEYLEHFSCIAQIMSNSPLEFLESETGKQDQPVTDKLLEVDSFTEESLPEEINEAVGKNVEELKVIKDGGDEISKMPNTLDEEACNEQHQTVNIEDKKLEESLLNSDADEKDAKGDEDTLANEDGAKKDKDESKDKDEEEEELLPLLRAIIGRTMQQSLVEVIEEEEDLRKRD